MKLRNLNGLIRKTEGSVKLRFATGDGPLVIGLVKSELLIGLAALYPDPQAETSLTIVDGRLQHEDGVDFGAVHGPKAEALYDHDFGDEPSVDLDDLLAAPAPADDLGDLLG